MKIKIIDILIKAIKQLQIFSSSIEKKEEAYIRFLSKYLSNYFSENKLNYLAQGEVNLGISISGESEGIADIVISENERKLAIIECLRISHANKQVILSHYERMLKHYLLDSKSEYYIISFVENPKTTWQQYLEIFSENNIPINDISDKSENNFKIAISNTIHDKETKSIYHINAWLQSVQTENKSKNKIETIKLYNFKLFENLEINLSPSINIFLGKNGYGKTTILQAIALANMPEQTIDLKYRKFVKQGQNSAEIYLKRKDEKELRITIDNDKRVYETEFTREPMFLAYGPNIFSKETRLDYDEIINSLLNGSSEWCFINSIFSDYDDKLYNTLHILQKLSDQKSQKATQIKDIIIKKLNDLIPDYKIGTQKNGSDYYFIDNSGNYLDLTQISEGYRTNILLITDIILKIISLRFSFNLHSSFDNIFNEAKGVIAIDEFDRHLHPLWQRKFVSDLQKHFPNIQFILTTHNPVSILNRNINEIQEIIYFNDNFQLKEVQEPTSLMDIELILLKYFGLNSVVGDLLQSKIDEYYEKRLKNEDSSVLEKELQNLLVGIPVTDIRYLKFLEILKQKGYNISNLQEMREIDFSSIAEELEWNEYLKSLHK